MRAKDMNSVRLSRIERKLDLLASRVTTGDRQTTRLERALTHMAVATAAGFKSVYAKLDLLPKLDAKVDVLSRRVAVVEAKLDLLPRLDAKLDSVMETQSHINSDLSDRVEDHEKRIDALEKRPA